MLAMHALVVALTTLPAAAGDGWLTDYEAALTQAKKSGKPVLAEFTGSDWCPPCMRLKQDVFSKEEFAAWAKANVVLLELDYPRQKQLPAELRGQNAELKEKYAIRAFPTILFLDGEGEVVGRTQGYSGGGVAGWIQRAEGVLKNAADAQRGEVEWLTSFEEAVARARKEDKLILAEFTGSDWCPPCKKLKKDVLESDAFKQWAAKHVVLLELDFPVGKEQPAELKEQNQALQKKYGIEAYPTILFLDAQGNRKGQIGGYGGDDPKTWIEAASKEAGIPSGKSDKKAI